jgi:coatomer protein complex subunit alpha (xenin)
MAGSEPKSSGCLLQPPTPIFRAANWPTHEIQKTTLENLSAEQGDEAYEAEVAAAAAASADAPMDTEDWADEEDGGAAAAPGLSAVAAADDFDFGADDDNMGDWGDDLDDLGDLGESKVAKPAEEDYMADMDSAGGFAMPTAGRPSAGCWVANSSHSADHLAAGAASSALQLLNRQIAASEFSLLKDSMVACYLGATLSIPGVPGSPSLSVPLMRNDATGHPGSESLPRTPLDLKALVEGVRSGYRFFQGGKFNDSRNSFAQVLTQIPLVVTSNRAEANEMKEMLVICREYITAIRIKGAMSEAVSSPVRATELSAYFTHCDLQSVHLLLALRSAMGTAFKHKNFIVAASFARRLLELPDMSSERNADLRTKATKVLQKSEQMARNEHELNYDETKTFTIDCQTFNPIYANTPSSSCSYCGSTYAGDMGKKLCLTCGFCTVGIQTIGLVTG